MTTIADTPTARSTRARLVTLVCAAMLAAAGCGPGNPPGNYYFFPLDEGTPVDIELTGTDAPAGASVSMSVNGTTLSTAGDRALIGLALEGIHVHPEWLVAVPGGTATSGLPLTLSFRLLSEEALYGASDEYTVSFRLVASAPANPAETEILVGSDEVGGGALAAQYAFDTPIPLYFDQCLGGSDDACTGGIALYAATNPGFAPRE